MTNLASVLIAGALIFVGSLRAQAPPIPAGTTSIIFDRHCDGMTITYSGSGSVIGGTHDNFDCVGSQTFLGGAVETVSRIYPAGLNATAVAHLADNVGPLMLNGMPLSYYLNFANNTWGLYIETDGVSPEHLIMRGTFTIVGPRARAAWRPGLPSYRGVPIAEDDAGAAYTPPYPKGPYTISLDGYCDYFTVYTRGNKAGGLHNFSTNCPGYFDVTFAGNNADLQTDLTGTAGASLSATDNEWWVNDAGDILANYYFNFAANTWVAWGVWDSTGQYAGIHGTFTLTPGVSAPARKGLPASIRRR